MVYVLLGMLAVASIWPIILIAGFVYGLFALPVILCRQCIRLILPRKRRTR